MLSLFLDRKVVNLCFIIFHIYITALKHDYVVSGLVMGSPMKQTCRMTLLGFKSTLRKCNYKRVFFWIKEIFASKEFQVVDSVPCTKVRVSL